MYWHTDGADWPNRGCSKFIKSGAISWHVQRMGKGPVLLLAHGTGAATHSWRDLMPALAQDFTVVAPDLPGHGFTTTPSSFRMTLPNITDALAELLRTTGDQPELVVGHSAGAAIGARLVLDGGAAPCALVALNGALLPYPGMHGLIYGGMAKLLALMPAAPWLFTLQGGDAAAARRLIAGTGSHLDDAGAHLYAKLLRDPTHVGNVLHMMADWDLEPLARDLPGLRPKLVLVAAEGDRAVPLKVARKVMALVPGAELVLQPGLGHLSHEEAPAQTAAIIKTVWQAAH